MEILMRVMSFMTPIRLSLTDIPQSKIIAIEPAIQGTSITIITENNKKFSFE